MITYNNKFMIEDNKPWFPTMGEIHYTRYPKEYWKESLYKMKSGGVDVIATYVIWIHHEEIKGEYDFSGSRDLRSFVQYVKDIGLKLVLRIGPWCHGEVRNGGFPDWLLKEDMIHRSDDERYLKEVKKYFDKVYSQVEGLFYKDGGPIIAIQIENEYGHSGGYDGKTGEVHMKTLTNMAKEAGLIAPIYTATGWGGAVTGGLLPVMGGYCDAPWDSSVNKLKPNWNYVFRAERDDNQIGSDFRVGKKVTFDYNDFPYLTCELGGGVQVTKHRRPYSTGKDIGAMSLVKLGSGANLLGYYMYHGGTNPEGKLTTLEENKETGDPNDLPRLSYDFNAPIKEYGQINEAYNEIKVLAMFIKDFGEDLAQMDVYFPNPDTNPNDFETLRWSIREKDDSGYLFVNNYQRLYELTDKVLDIKYRDITFPKINVKNEDFFFLPYNLKMESGILKTSNLSPLCKLNDSLVLYGDREPINDVTGDISLINISRADALNSNKIHLDRDYLLICENPIIESEDGYSVLTNSPKTIIKVYPDLDINGFNKVGMDGEFYVYEKINNDTPEIKTSHKLVSETKTKKIYEVEIEYNGDFTDAFLHIDYFGSIGNFYINNKIVGDDFYKGGTWDIGLKKFDFPKKLLLEILDFDEPCYLEVEREDDFILKNIKTSYENTISI